MTPVIDDDAVGVDLGQTRPPDNKSALPARARERRAAFVSEPGTGRCRLLQDPGFVEKIRADPGNIALGVMQRLVILENDPGGRGEPPEGVARADEGALGAWR